MKPRKLFGWWLVIPFFLAIILNNIQNKINYHQKAAETNCLISVNAGLHDELKRNWEYYSQGGEEKTFMLQPVFNQVKELRPKQIRIDHVFDFPSLDLRLLEIKRLGAVPFISLSYFPPSISSELTKMPASLGGWSDLIAQTAETINQYFGDETIYFEVWNEPDLFGDFTADEYFYLYQATVEGLDRCPGCKYKIGGPSITTMKLEWMNRFLSLVNQNNVRLDFVSWHSYQKNTYKTMEERTKLVDLNAFKNLRHSPELIITEWGITPEISYLNDGLESASHTVAFVSQTTGLIDKVFAFELKDGLDPQGKQFWGRWGLITHQDLSIQTKPRYHSFAYLNQLGNYRLILENPQNDNYLLATADYPSDITVVMTNSSKRCQSLDLLINMAPNGTYNYSLYSLDNLHNPSLPTSEVITINNRRIMKNFTVAPDGVYLAKFNRTTAGSTKGQGRNASSTTNYSVRLGQNFMAAEYPVYDLSVIRQAEINFWYKSLIQGEGEQDGFYQVFSTSSSDGPTLVFGFEKTDQNSKLILNRIVPGGRMESFSLNLEQADLSLWHNYRFSFNNNLATLTIAFDNQTYTAAYENSWPTELGRLLVFGADNGSINIDEGYLDDLNINLQESKSLFDSFDSIY